MSGNLTSKVTILQMLSLASYSITWSGSTPIGTVAVQVSNDYSENPDGSVRNAGNWSDLPLSAATAVAGASGTGFIDIDTIAGYALRLQYRRVSGTGTMQVVVSGKCS